MNSAYIELSITFSKEKQWINLRESEMRQIITWFNLTWTFYES